jgi:hypothetical protein
MLKQMGRKYLTEFYLEWWNNYLTVAKMAEHHEISEVHCHVLIEMGRCYHNEYCDMMKENTQ